MPAETVQALLTQTKEAAAKRTADVTARYGKLVLRAARGEHLEPEAVLQSLTSWGMDAATRTGNRVAQAIHEAA